MANIQLAIKSITNGLIYFFNSFLQSYLTVVSGIFLSIFELYADIALTSFNIARKFVNQSSILALFFRPFSVVLAYLFIYPTTYFATAYVFLRLSLRPFLKKPFDFNVSIPSAPPAILADEKGYFGKHSYVQLKRIKLHIVDNVPTDKDKNPINYDYLIVFLHGFGGFWFSWRYQIQFFSQVARTVAIDMRGYGQSEKPFKTKDYDLKFLAEDLKELLDEINEDRSKKVILIGHSWGGHAIYEFLLNYSNYIEKYITIAAPPTFLTELTAKQIVELWYAYFYLLPYMPEYYLESNNLKYFDELYATSFEEVIQAYKYTYGKSGSFSYPLNYYKANFVKLFEYICYGNKAIEKINKEGLAIYGDRDTIIDSAVYDNGFVVPKLTVKEVHGDHYPHEDPYRSYYLNQAMLFFIDPTIKCPDPPKNKKLTSVHKY